HRLFAGLSIDEAAEAMGISRASAFREWAYAHSWLATALDSVDDRGDHNPDRCPAPVRERLTVVPGSPAVSLRRSCPYVRLIAERCFSSACSPSTREASGNRGFVDLLALMRGSGQWSKRSRASVRHAEVV